VDLWTTLWYLGVPIRDVSYMFGDNKSLVNSSTQPHSKLQKRHNALSFHRVHEAIASGYVVLTYLATWKVQPCRYLEQALGIPDYLADPQAYLVLPWRYSRPHSRSRYWLDIPPTGRNYLLRYMCINFLGNRPQADGEWQKLHSHAYTHAMVCSFVSFTYYLIYLRRWIAKKIRLWRCLLHCSFPSHSW
jgi:hypothetical protein